MKVVVTGANGFVGKHLCNYLSKSGYTVIELSRSFNCKRKGNTTLDVFLSDEWVEGDIDALIHLVGAAHSVFTDAEAESINYEITQRVLKKSLLLNIPKFVYLSTAGVYDNQEKIISIETEVSKNLKNIELSKLRAEKVIKEASEKGWISSTVIRSPLVYGENVKANFASLIRLVDKCLPLPFRLINNKRSLISVYNLVDLIKICIEHPKAGNKMFLVSDDMDLSTAEMVALMAEVQNKKNLALPVPLWCFKLAGKLLNKNDVIDRLTGSLQLDITHTKNILGWQPRYSVEHGFKLAAKKPFTK